MSELAKDSRFSVESFMLVFGLAQVIYSVVSKYSSTSAGISKALVSSTSVVVGEY